MVFKQGEEVEDVYFIAEGAARLVREVENRETLRRLGVTRRGPGCLFGKTRGRGLSWDEPPTPPGLANEWLDANEDGEDRFAPDAASESNRRDSSRGLEEDVRDRRRERARGGERGDG